MQVTNSMLYTEQFLLIDKEMIKKEGLIYTSVYKQLLYVNEYSILHGTLDNDGYFKYSLEFLARMFKIDFADIFNVAVRLRTNNLIDFKYSIDLKIQSKTVLIMVH